MFKNAKVGDRVWSFGVGWGTIDCIFKEDTHPIKVTFDDCAYVHRFMEDGRVSAYALSPTLFWDEIEFEIPRKPLPDIPVDTKMLIWKIGKPFKKKRHFSHFDEDGNCYCFDNGRTSWTSEFQEKCDYWEIAEEDNKTKIGEEEC